MPGYPQLHVLDSSDPEQIKALEDAIDFCRTLFIVASKSGTTTEPEAFFRYFYDRVQKAVGGRDAGRQFVAITDPGTELAEEAKQSQVPARVHQRSHDRRPLFGALVFRHGARSDRRLRRARASSIAELGALHANARARRFAAPMPCASARPSRSSRNAGRDKLTIVCTSVGRGHSALGRATHRREHRQDGTRHRSRRGRALGDPARLRQRSDLRLRRSRACRRRTTSRAHGRLRRSKTRLDALESRPSRDRAPGNGRSLRPRRAVRVLGDRDGDGRRRARDRSVRSAQRPRVQGQHQTPVGSTTRRTGRSRNPRSRLDNESPASVPLRGSHALNLGADLAGALARGLRTGRAGDYVAFTAYIEMNGEHERALHELRSRCATRCKRRHDGRVRAALPALDGPVAQGRSANTGVFLQLTADPQDRPADSRHGKLQDASSEPRRSAISSRSTNATGAASGCT